MSSLRVAALLSLLASVSTAFVPLSPMKFASLSTSTTITPTTLFYRDDMNPRDYSSTKWQTPNDFDQFLTQCSIQSLMVLLQSLRDDPTVFWLHEFTQPVMRVTNSTTTTTTTPAVETTNNEPLPPPAKINLDQAVQAALEEPAQLLKPFTTPKNKKHKKPTTGSAASAAASSSKSIVKPEPKAKNAVDSSNSNKTTNRQKKRPRLAVVPTAFTAFSQRATEMSALFSLCDEEDEECNTDIYALYNSPPMLARPKPKATTSSDSSSKSSDNNNDDSSSLSPTASDMSSLYSSGPNQGNTNPAPVKRKAAWTPATSSRNRNNPKVVTTSCTSALYAAPKQDASTSDNASSSQQQQPSDHAAQPYFKLWRYHGLAALNVTKFPTSMAYFEQLLQQPKQSWMVQSKTAAYTTTSQYQYKLEIDPASLCSRLLSVRNQIAQEFQYDLGILASMGGDTLKSYWAMRGDERKQQHREKQEENKSPEQKNHEKKMLQQGKQYPGADAKDNASPKKDVKPVLQRANLLFLEQAPPSSENPDYAPSPCRKGNFDLLHLFSTQEAIHRVLNDPKRQARKSAEHGSNQFLQDFYVTRIWSHFSGDVPYGRADDFLEELLDCPPRMITVGGGDGDSIRNGKDVAEKDGNGDKSVAKNEDQENSLTKDLTYLIDPLGIVETILNEREKVALEWQAQVAEQTKQDHMTIQRLVLGRLMQSSTEDKSSVENPVNIELAFTKSGGTNHTEVSIFE